MKSIMRHVKYLDELLNNYDKENCMILDVGCGRGDLVFELKNLGFHNVRGIDKDRPCQYKESSSKDKDCSSQTQNYSFDNILMQLDVKDILNEFNAGSFDVIICCRSLHFLSDIPQALNSFKQLLKKPGQLIIINYPIFTLNIVNDDSAFLNQLFEDFYSSTFKDELSEYWNDTVSENFLKYCDPERKNNTFWTQNNQHSLFSVKTSAHPHVSVQTSVQNTPCSVNKSSAQSEHSTSNINPLSVQCTQDLVYTDYESVKIMQSEHSEEISLLDINPLLRKSTVVQHFINKHGLPVFESQLNSFLQSVCILLDIELADLYFEDDITTRITSTQSYTMEIHTLTSKQP